MESVQKLLEHLRTVNLFLHFQAQRNVADKVLTKVMYQLVVETALIDLVTTYTKDIYGDIYKNKPIEKKSIGFYYFIKKICLFKH